MKVGDFIKYRNFHMAVVAINEDSNKVYALCYENHKMAIIDLSEDVEVMENGCSALVRSIYSDLDRCIRGV